MAQVTQIQIICDECLRVDGAQNEASEFQTAGLTIALCEKHYSKLLSPILPLLDHLTASQKRGKGKVQPVPAKPAEPAEDAFCEKCKITFSGTSYKRPKQALVMHNRKHHKTA